MREKSPPRLPPLTGFLVLETLSHLPTGFPTIVGAARRAGPFQNLHPYLHPDVIECVEKGVRFLYGLLSDSRTRLHGDSRKNIARPLDLLVVEKRVHVLILVSGAPQNPRPSRALFLALPHWFCVLITGKRPRHQRKPSMLFTRVKNIDVPYIVFFPKKYFF